MAAFQFTAFNLQMAQDYFSHLNPLAQRISTDINATKSTYGQLWNNLKANQQNEIINETLIKPEIALKYFENLSSSSTTLFSNSTSSSTSSANISTTSAEHILAVSSAREQNYSPNVNNSIATNLLTDNIIKQTQNLLSNTLAARAKHTVQTLGKLKPPSSPPPPPPIATQKYTKAENAEKYTKLGTQKALRNELTKPTNEKSNYFYDGSNLHTYAAQKVALKIIYDDVLGAYRDEHSQPFSYRTKSQLDLQQQYYESNSNDDDDDVKLQTNCDNILLHTTKEPCNVNLIENCTLTKNYEQLQQELKCTLNNHLETLRKNDASDVNQKSSYDMSSKVSTTNNYGVNKRVLPIPQAVTNIQTAEATQAQSAQTTNKCDSKSSKYLRENIEKYTNEGAAAYKTNLNYAVYTDVYFEQGESATLMQNCNNSGILTASTNSSTTTSDDDEHNNYEYDDDDDDEKTLCEDIRLLENDLNLRRGFDFLNNW